MGGSTLMVNGQAVAPGTPLAPMTLPYPETNIEIKVTLGGRSRHQNLYR